MIRTGLVGRFGGGRISKRRRPRPRTLSLPETALALRLGASHTPAARHTLQDRGPWPPRAGRRRPPLQGGSCGQDRACLLAAWHRGSPAPACSRIRVTGTYGRPCSSPPKTRLQPSPLATRTGPHPSPFLSRRRPLLDWPCLVLTGTSAPSPGSAPLTWVYGQQDQLLPSLAAPASWGEALQVLRPPHPRLVLFPSWHQTGDR